MTVQWAPDGQTVPQPEPPGNMTSDSQVDVMCHPFSLVMLCDRKGNFTAVVSEKTPEQSTTGSDAGQSCYIVCTYEYVTANPIIMCNYNAPVKNKKKEGPD